MEVVAYVRVSTDRQAEEGLGLEVQESAISDWAAANGHRVVAVCVDAGVSGTKELDARPGLADTLAATMPPTSAAGIVVYRLDRLARDLVLQEQLLSELWRRDLTVFSASGAEAVYLQDDPDDPSRRLIRQVLGAVSEYERAMISLRLRSGRRRKSESGGFAYGSPPFGYRAQDKNLVKQDAEQAVIREAVDLRASGQSLRQISIQLDLMGLKPRRATSWHPEGVRRLLARAIADPVADVQAS